MKSILGLILLAASGPNDTPAATLDNTSIIAALVALTVMVIAALIAFAVAVRASLAKNASEWSKDEAENWLRIVTVCALILAAMFLGVLGLLTGTITTFLGTIAGFVLGGVQKKRSQKQK
jgi:hypothetical protein